MTMTADEAWKKYANISPVGRTFNNDGTVNTEGSMMIWHVPQVPGPTFYFPVSSIKEAKSILDCLADYDIFQYKNKIKPDYCNTGGLLVFEDGEWIEWADPITNDDVFECPI